MDTLREIETTILKSMIKQFNGTEKYYEHQLTDRYKLRLTDGCQFLKERARCYWLFDLITIHQSTDYIRNQPMQVWKLTQESDGSFTVKCTDGNQNLLASQKMIYEDFPLPEITIWVENGVALLPTEH